MHRCLSFGLAATTAMVVLSCSASGQVSDLKSQIQAESPAFYWPLENSFWSEARPTGYLPVLLDAFAQGTADNFGSVDLPTDYFPLFPPHMTMVPGSSALVFSEYEGEYAGSQRILSAVKADFKNTGVETSPLTALGMTGYLPWTVHVVLSPEDDPDNIHGWETVLMVGKSTEYVKLEIDRQAGQTLFRLTRKADPGVATSTQNYILLDSSNLNFVVNGRQWYQVFAEGYQDTFGFGVELRINGVDGVRKANNDPITGSPSGESLRLGTNNTDKRFHGAMHHFTVWTETLTLGRMQGLEYALTTPSTARQPLAIDWNPDPAAVRYYMWSVPVNETPSDRSLLVWTDPIWDNPSVYPMVRFKMDDPTSSGSHYTPPDGAVQIGWEPEDVAMQTVAWINYIQTKLSAYSYPTKSLAQDGYSLYMQNWGRVPKPAQNPDYYADWGAVRALMRNPRDTPLQWRGADMDGGSPGNGLQQNNVDLEQAEIWTPFFREGMSQNAFRTREIFRVLRENNVPLPTRLHWDGECSTDFQFSTPSDPNTPIFLPFQMEGWWMAATFADPGGRYQLPAHWRDNDMLSATPIPGSLSVGPHHTANDAFGSSFMAFSMRQYDYALGQALLTPAIQEFGPGIRMGEYWLVDATANAGEQQFNLKASRPTTDVEMDSMDFTSPVLYPLERSKISGTNIDAILAWWGTLGMAPAQSPSFPGSDPMATLERDLSRIFVAHAQHNSNAAYLAGGGAVAGKPMAPWIPLPGQTYDISYHFDVDGFPGVDGTDADPLLYTARWQDIARIVIFAYRHGAREFLVWCDDGIAADADNVVEFELVMAALDNAIANPRDLTTIGHLSRDQANFGIPDGVVTTDDFQYFLDRWNEGDLEADIVGANGHPDGQVTHLDQVSY